MTERSGILVRASLHRPVTVFMLLVTLGVVGVIAYRLIPLQLVPPGITEPNISISIPVPDSTPREVMEEVAKPAEDLLRTIPGVSRIRSRSTSSSCRLTVSHGPEADGATVYDDIRDRMERLVPSLPDGADRYRIFRFNVESDLPVMMMAISFGEEVEDPDTLLENVVQSRLEAIDGVAQVNFQGIIAREVELELDPDAVAAYQINVQRLIQRLVADNQVIPGGVVHEGGNRYLLRLNSRLRSFEEVLDYPINDSLELGQIANVGFVRGLRNFMARVDGDVCRVLELSKESEANTVATCERVQAELDRLTEDPRLDSFRFIPFFSQGEMIEASVGGLRSTCAWGGLLAVIVLFLFLWDIRLTLLVASAIPLSLLIAVVVIFFRGGTFNILSLCGLTLGIGMLIDNAIVIAENIYRNRQLGLAPKVAAERGVKEVSLAVTLATLTTVAVFLPLIFLSGSDSNINTVMRELGLPVCYSLLASLAVALVFVPLATTLLPQRAQQSGKQFFLARPYKATLSWVLRHRFLAVILCGLVLATMSIPQKIISNRKGDAEAVQDVWIRVECPRYFTLVETDEVMEEIRGRIDPHRKELGLDSMAAMYGRTGGRLAFFLEPDTRVTEVQFLERIKPLIPEIAGVRVQLGSDEDEDDSKEIYIRATGRDPTVLISLLGEVGRRVQNAPGVLDIRTPSDDTSQEIVVDISRERAQRYGVNPTNVSSLVGWALRGAPLSDFHVGDQELPFWIRYAGGDLGGIGDLYRVPVYTDEGQEVPVSNLASFGVSQGLPSIYRRDGLVSSWIRLVTESDANESQLKRRVHAEFDALDVPDGYQLEVSGGGERPEAIDDAINAGILGLVLIFVLMGVLFESFILPVSVLFCIPFLFLGALWFAMFQQTTLGEMGIVGFVILLGIVVNNGIVLIDCINRFRAEGMDRRSAILAAGEARLRPILMTACTTVFGLMPLILFEQRGEGIPYKPLGVVVTGGLVTATGFTLVVVPMCYTLLDDLRTLLLAPFRERPPAAAEPALEASAEG